MIKATFLEDRVQISYRLSRVSGFPDEDVSNEILYSSIDGLPLFPSDFVAASGKGLRLARWREDIHIPICDKTIAYICESVPENSQGEREDSVSGPYLVR
jgi:hypothetical protein